MKTLLLATSTILLVACGSDNTQDAGNGSPDAGAMNQTDQGTANAACDPGFGAATACGGDLEGSWNYQSACSSTPLGAAIRDACDQANIRAERFLSGMGNLSITGGSFALMVQTDVEVEATIPTSCAQGLGCAVIEQAIESGSPGSQASCTSSGADCDCRVTGTVASTSSGQVSTNGGVATVTTSNGTEQYYFCVEGGSLSYRRFDNGDDNPVFVLTR